MIVEGRVGFKEFRNQLEKKQEGQKAEKYVKQYKWKRMLISQYITI